MRHLNMIFRIMYFEKRVVVVKTSSTVLHVLSFIKFYLFKKNLNEFEKDAYFDFKLILI